MPWPIIRFYVYFLVWRGQKPQRRLSFFSFPVSRDDNTLFRPFTVIGVIFLNPRPSSYCWISERKKRESERGLIWLASSYLHFDIEYWYFACECIHFIFIQYIHMHTVHIVARDCREVGPVTNKKIKMNNETIIWIWYMGLKSERERVQCSSECTRELSHSLIMRKEGLMCMCMYMYISWI